MLRINQSTHAAAAQSYYSTADYYTEGQELTGRWCGEGARLLGLSGDVQQAEWNRLCDNLHPLSGERLTQRTNADRTVGYDFNFHVPKSLSLLYSVTRDERLLEAFREAVDVTMHDMEAEMATRVRKNGRNENRRTGNLTWGQFIHFTSRPVDGVPDPHLHAHCYVFNTTWDAEERAWKAGQFRELKRDAPYFEAVFHAHLAGRLADMGLPIERTAQGWELGGLDKSTLDKFSRRTKQIEEKAREKGITDVAQKSELGAKTRQRKVKNLSFPELQATWRGWMSEDELASLKLLEQRTGDDPLPTDGSASARAVDYAVEHALERKSVVPERQLVGLALRQAVGQAKVADVWRAAAQYDGLIVGERGGRRMATTAGILREERKLVDFARRGRGTCRPLGGETYPRKRDWLNADQEQAVQRLLRSRDRVTVLRGAAGVGKTTLMQEVVEAIEAAGTRVFACAPSADAGRGVLRNDGFQQADTVARLLLDDKLQQELVGQTIWVDEAGLLGTVTMARLFELAERLEARVLLSGDRKQHGSVERGAALRLLEEEAGIVPAEVKEIQRQRGEYKEAVRLLSEGQSAAGLKRLDDLGWVKEDSGPDRYRQLAEDYVATVRSGKSALVVSPTHYEGRYVTQHLRSALQQAGIVGRDERSFRILENARLTAAERSDRVRLRPDDLLVFHQNAKGYRRGERVTVGTGADLPLAQANRYQVFHQATLGLAAGDLIRITQNGRTADGAHRLDNGMQFKVRGFDDGGNIVLANGWTIDRDWGHWEYGYVLTSHAAQGKTVDHVLIGQSGRSFSASSREQFYVSASRARERVTVYTDDKAALEEAVSRSDSRLTATEFINSAIGREATADRLPTIDKPERELIHER